MGWSRSSRGRRRAPSGGDPVSDALTWVADLRLTPRIDGERPTAGLLADVIEVHADNSQDEFNTRVDLADEIHLFCDPDADGLERALADQDGIDEVFAEDREVVYVASRLALADVHAAVIRAVVDVNLHPREPGPTHRLSEQRLAALAEQVAPTLLEAGFHTRDGETGRYFNRVTDDGLVHVVAVTAASGERGDGTVLDGRVLLYSGVAVPGVEPAPAPELDFYPPGYCLVLAQDYPAPADLPAAVVAALDGLAPYGSRASWARWTAEDPTRIDPPAWAPNLALLFAQWGHLQDAEEVLRYVEGRSEWLANSREANEARDLLRR